MKYLKIFCDSQAALKALESRTIHSSLVKETVETLSVLADSGIVIRLVWIKAHVDHLGNERADQLAKEGTRQDPELQIRMPKPMVYVHNLVDEAVLNEWGTSWRLYDKARQTKQFFPSTGHGKATGLLKLNRRSLSRIISATTGHGPFGYFQNLLDPEINPLCRFCGEVPETFFHLITDCPAFLDTRAACFGYYEVSEVKDWSVASLGQFIETECVGAIFLEKEAPPDTSISIEEKSDGSDNHD